MDPEYFEKLKALEKELLESPGWIWERRMITNLGTTFYIFQGNRNQLCAAIEWFEKGEESFKLLDVRRGDSLHDFFREIMRLFHNYLARIG